MGGRIAGGGNGTLGSGAGVTGRAAGAWGAGAGAGAAGTGSAGGVGASGAAAAGGAGSSAAAGASASSFSTARSSTARLGAVPSGFSTGASGAACAGAGSAWCSTDSVTWIGPLESAFPAHTNAPSAAAATSNDSPVVSSEDSCPCPWAWSEELLGSDMGVLLLPLAAASLAKSPPEAYPGAPTPTNTRSYGCPAISGCAARLRGTRLRSARASWGQRR